jgi:predicted ATP-binding protein involved in virulence
MLKNITVTDFLQEGKTLSWDLHPEVNILWGENGSGKTVLMNAIYSANRWNNTAYLDENTTLTWERNPANPIMADYGIETLVPMSNLNHYLKDIQEHVSFNVKGRLSAGQSKLVQLLGSALFYKTHQPDVDLIYKDVDSVLVIDDIETNLHIDIQRTIIKQLREINPNCQLIVTTHSPSILMGYMSEGSNIEDLLT